MIFIQRSREAVAGAARVFLFALLAFLALNHVANLLEWRGHLWADAAADLLSVVVPLLWGLFLFEIGRNYLAAQVAAGTEQLRFYLEKVPAAVACLNADEKLEAFSLAWARLAPRSEVGRRLFEVLPANLPKLREAIRLCALEGKESGANEEDARDAAEVHYFRWGVRGFQHPDHQRPLIMLMLEELTADVEAEARRSEAAEELARAERMAQLGQLAAGAAHDFNNLLQVIQASAYELKENPDDSEAALTDLTRALTTAGDMTKFMLQFGRAGGDTSGAVDLRALVRDLGRLLSHALGRRHRFVATITEQPVLVHGNATRLQQAILNLVTNARDAMPEGGQIEVSLSRCNGDALLEVRDSGIGMTESVQKQLFKPFFTTKDTRGTGLGLAMVRKTVEEHRGQVSVQSEPGVGTTFSVRLPLQERQEADAE